MVGTGNVQVDGGCTAIDLARPRSEEVVTSTVPHQALYRRWRAQTFGEIVGQEAVVETLRNAVRADRVSHAVLFVGPRGTGKTSLARILAKAVNCTDLQDGDACDRCPSCVSIREGTTLDLIEIDAASNRGIDAVRDLRERLPYPPGQLKRKVYILDEAHQITRDAWNALLKSLEEPPDFVIFMFASTEPSGFPPAILSRLQRFDVRRLTVAEIEGKLARILAADGRVADPAAVHLIARLAAGGMRDAESMLDQLLSAAPERIEESTVRDLLGLADAEVVDGVRRPPRPRRRGGRRRPPRQPRGARPRHPGAARPGRRGDPRRADRRARRHRSPPPRQRRPRRRRSPPRRHRPEPGRHRRPPLPARARDVRAASVDRAVGARRDRGSDRRASGDPDRARRHPRRPTSPRPEATPPPTRSDATPRGTDAPGRQAPRQPDDAAVRPRPEPEPAPTPCAAAAAARATEPARTPPDAGPPSAAASSLVDGSGSDLEQLLAAWPAIVAQLSAHPPTKPLIVACRPVAVDGAIVTLGFPEEQAFLKDAAERRRPAIEAGISSVIGHPVTVRCVVANVELASAGLGRPRGRGAPDLRRRPRRRRRDQLTQRHEPGCRRRPVPAD